jgi:hypothetical protein
MDQTKLSYFLEKFDSYDADELCDLALQRSDLAEEAIEALDRVLSRKGLNTALLTLHAESGIGKEEEASATLAEQTNSSRQLWRGGLASACKFMVAMTFIGPIQTMANSFSLGAVWVGLAVVVAGYAGYRLGHTITKSICADLDDSLSTKKKKLWILFLALWPVFFIVYLASHLLFIRN